MDFDLIISKAQEIIAQAQNGKANASIITVLDTASNGNLTIDGITFETDGANFDAIVGDEKTALASTNTTIATTIVGLADDIKAEAA